MINKTFGSYIVLERNYTSHPQAQARYWNVKCIHCGQNKIIRSDGLKKQPICKCQKEDKMINNVFGEFLVLEKTDQRSKDKCIIYKCQCIYCNNIELIASNVLRSQRKCCSYCHIKQSNLRDITGQIYGHLEVLERDMSQQHMGHGNDAYWICKCLKCGSLKSIRGNSIRYNKTISCGCIKSRGEEEIATLLTQHSIPFEREYTFSDLYDKNSKNKMRFDFAIFDANHNLLHLLEYDGCQHFLEGVRDTGWNSIENYEKTKSRDQIKNEYCQKNNIKLIRISYKDIINIEKILGENNNDFK